jgi:hypothetical protein
MQRTLHKVHKMHTSAAGETAETIVAQGFAIEAGAAKKVVYARE